MPLGYVPGRSRGLSARLFGSRKYSRAIEWNLVRQWLGHPGGLVLDLGCGDGEFAAELTRMGYRVVGLDLSRPELVEASAVNGPQGGWICGDATGLPFADGSFDLVFSNSVIEHIPDADAVFREVRRVLKPGGAFVFTTDTFPPAVSRWLSFVPHSWRRPEFRLPGGSLEDPMRASHRDRHHVVQHYTAAGMQTVLAHHGFAVECLQPYMNGPVTAGIFELHLVLSRLDFYNATSRRLFPLFYPFTFVARGTGDGYGLAVRAVRPSV